MEKITTNSASTLSVTEKTSKVKFRGGEKIHQQQEEEPNASSSILEKNLTNIAEIAQEEELSRQWKKTTKSMYLVQQLVKKGISPRRILSILYPIYSVPADIPDVWILQLLQELCEQRTREKLPQWNTFEDAIELFRRSRRILVITGAGVSVSCGIPDFRSKNGIYERLHKDFPELPDPHSMFDIEFFRHNPAPFYNFAREIFPGQYRPSISHMFIKYLEEEGKLLRNYTQNIDTLERLAGIQNLVECHGSFARSTCLNCKQEVDSEEIKEYIDIQQVPHCSKCKIGLMKPNIVFFGEDLGDLFHAQMGEDHEKLDLLVVIGSSMQVRPVSLVPFNINSDIPQILINREVLPNYPADIKLLGNCDGILTLLSLALGGEMREKMVKELHSRDATPMSSILFNNLMDTEEPFLPNKIQLEEFRRIIGVDENMIKEEEGYKDKQNHNEPERKKPRLNEETLETSTSQTQDVTSSVPISISTAITNCWEGNYVLVESHLPTPNSTILVPPNLNVFAGAELFYDRDQDTFVRRTGIKQCYEDDEHEYYECDQPSDSFSSDSSSSDGEERGCSLPPELDGDGDTNGALKHKRWKKSASCPLPNSSQNQS